ncbi:MAG: hypothetical protein IJK24_04230 [Oscillospiraceae bacterium]|nr:hypothetical protein [Oscillospiraceae bacterium]
MYLKEKLIRALKVKNVLFLIAGIFLILVSVYYFTVILVEYYGDWFTIRHARGMPGAFRDLGIGLLLILCSRVSRNLVNDASFFSRYFEGDLSGYIEFQELAEITGRKLPQVRRRLKLLRRLYMKKFQFSCPEGRKEELVELYSKKVTCTCRSCGGAMEKRVYFTGECPYCGSSDLTARVVSGEHFFCIYDDKNRRVNDPSWYRGRNLTGRQLLLAAGLILAFTAALISAMVFFSKLFRINDDAYIKERFWKLLLDGGHPVSYERVREEMGYDMILCAMIFAAVFPAFPLLFARLLGISRAIRFSLFFSRIPDPYVPVPDLGLARSVSLLSSQLPPIVALSGLSGAKRGDPQRELRRLVKALREGYLRGCAPEKHGGPLRIGLAKRIVKDRCPNCAAPITGAVDENYSCKYCGSLIMSVIRKN